MFHGDLPKFGNKVKIGNKLSKQIGVMSDQLRVTDMVMSKNVILHLGEAYFIMFDEIPISTMKRPEDE